LSTSDFPLTKMAAMNSRASRSRPTHISRLAR
jgi:hypothetical protein